VRDEREQEEECREQIGERLIEAWQRPVRADGGKRD
jgi:hypothetical protein